MIEERFDMHYEQLSVRAKNILRFNKLTSLKALYPWINGTRKDFLLLRNVGAKTSKELMSFISILRDEIDECDNSGATQNGGFSNDDNWKKNASLQLILNNLIKSLSARSRNTLRISNLTNVEALSPWIKGDRTDFLKFENIGMKTSMELMTLISELKRNVEDIQTTPINLEHTNTQSQWDNVILKYIHPSALPFIRTFKLKNGYWPVAFMLFCQIERLLTRSEIRVLLQCVNKRNRKWLTIDKIATDMCCSKERIRQLFLSAISKICENALIKQICESSDGLTCKSKNFSHNILLDTDTVFCENRSLLRQEVDEYEYYTTNNVRVYSTHLSLLNVDTLWILPICCNMTPYWIDESKKELSQFPIEGVLCYINKDYSFFEYNKAIKEVSRLINVKTTNNICISIKSYFIENNDFHVGTAGLAEDMVDGLEEILVSLFEYLCNVRIHNGNIMIQANAYDHGQRIYEILKKEGHRLYRDEILNRLMVAYDEMGVSSNLFKSSQLTSYLTKDSRFVAYGKSGYWGLKEWNEKTGSIRELAIALVRRSIEPIQIDDLCKSIIEFRPDSSEKSISSIVRQTVSAGELVLFFGDYIWIPQKECDESYIVMPQTFDDYCRSYISFVKKHYRLPYSGNGFEGYLYRWYYKANQYTDLSSKEILQFEELKRNIKHYPQNATEYNFLQNCNLYKDFVETNRRMLTIQDDPILYRWFYKASQDYTTWKDNRSKYYSQLLQSIASLLYLNSATL